MIYKTTFILLGRFSSGIGWSNSFLKINYDYISVKYIDNVNFKGININNKLR